MPNACVQLHHSYIHALHNIMFIPVQYVQNLNHATSYLWPWRWTHTYSYISAWKWFQRIRHTLDYSRRVPGLNFFGFNCQTDSSVDNEKFTNVTEFNMCALYSSEVNLFIISSITHGIFWKYFLAKILNLSVNNLVHATMLSTLLNFTILPLVI